MPLYEYKCASCGDVFEVIQKFGDAPLTTHEGCGGSVKRLLSSPALQFKGSGWYVNDYGKSGRANSGSSNSEAKSESKSESKSETKPAASGTKSDSK